MEGELLPADLLRSKRQGESCRWLLAGVARQSFRVPRLHAIQDQVLEPFVACLPAWKQCGLVQQGS